MDVININHVITHYERVASLYKRYSLEKRDFRNLVKEHNIHNRMQALWREIIRYRDKLSKEKKQEITEKLTDISVILQEFNLYYIGKGCENQVLAQCKSFQEHTAKECENNSDCANDEIEKICKSLIKYGQPLPLPCEGKSFDTIVKRSVEATVQSLLQYPTFTKDEVTQYEVNALAEELEDILPQDGLQDILPQDGVQDI